MIGKLAVFLFLIIAVAFSLFLFNQSKRVTPEFLSPLTKNTEQSAVLAAEDFFASNNLWFPNTQPIASKQPAPEISARSAIVVDLTTNQTLYAKNIDNKQPVASTVKIMTAVVALERRHNNEIFTVSAEAAAVGEDAMGVTAGEKYTLRELLYGLMLASGNDASEVIAENVAGSGENFVKLMNEKAALLGAKDTKFINPSGLEEDGEQYSTVYDLAIISQYAWTNFPIFRQVVGTANYEIPYTENHKYLYLENQTNLLATYPGVKGIKPGFTPQAGLCLVTLAENGGHQILAVILGSNDRRGEMIKLLDYSFATLGINI